MIITDTGVKFGVQSIIIKQYLLFPLFMEIIDIEFITFTINYQRMKRGTSAIF